MRQILLLHGAIGAADQLAPLAGALAELGSVNTLSFSGHGGKPLPEAFSIEAFADDVLHFLNEQGVAQSDLFGYSMGGYVSLYLARHAPERIGRVVTLATKFEWTPDIAAKESRMLAPETLAEKVPQFAQTLAHRHAPNDWKRVLQQTATMLHEMGARNPLSNEDFTAIEQQCLLLLGDRDKMVGLDETVNVYRLLPKAQMGVLPNTPHPIESLPVPTVALMMRRFLQG